MVFIIWNEKISNIVYYYRPSEFEADVESSWKNDHDLYRFQNHMNLMVSRIKVQTRKKIKYLSCSTIQYELTEIVVVCVESLQCIEIFILCVL